MSKLNLSTLEGTAFVLGCYSYTKECKSSASKPIKKYEITSVRDNKVRLQSFALGLSKSVQVIKHLVGYYFASLLNQPKEVKQHELKGKLYSKLSMGYFTSAFGDPIEGLCEASLALSAKKACSVQLNEDESFDWQARKNWQLIGDGLAGVGQLALGALGEFLGSVPNDGAIRSRGFILINEYMDKHLQK